MKILFLSFYYPPDLSAGSFRATALIRALADRLPPGTEIDVLTTVPNRYRSFAAPVPAFERIGAVTINRVELPPHRSGLVDQSRAFLSYAMGTLRFIRGRRYALVAATSSRLMTAVLASAIARRHGAPLYLDIRDIFIENITEVLPRGISTVVRWVLGPLERLAFGRASHINLVSQGFTAHFAARYPGKRYSYHTNGVDDEFVALSSRAPAARAADSTRLPVVLYAGNIGEGQGLHRLLPGLAARMRERARFRVIGDGGRRVELEASLAAAGLQSVVEVLPPMPRGRLVEEYLAADVLLLHLNDHVAFRTVLPSKVFEYAATGKPILAGVDGFAAEFVREHVRNAIVFAPCDVPGAEDALTRIELGHTPRGDFVSRFARRSISDAMAGDILALLPRA